MKKLILAATLLISSFGAYADPHHGSGIRYRPHVEHRVWRPGIGWVVPVVIGGVVSYEIWRANRPTVIVEREEIGTTVTCTEWHEVQLPDGKIIKERTCTK